MAVTSIWPIHGRLDKPLAYACNPEKTSISHPSEVGELHTMDQVIAYAARAAKTEQCVFVTALGCTKEDAAAQFAETQAIYQSSGSRVCYHGYQSFREGEVTAEIAHQIGVELAERLWGERFEVLIATHLNTDCFHNHFVINAVSFVDGKKFYNSKADYREMRAVSDELCQNYGLSVLEQSAHKGQHYAAWKAEQTHAPTLRSTIRADIDRAIAASITERQFVEVMTKLGYQLKTRKASGEPLKYPALKPQGAKGYFRFHKLGEDYTLDRVKGRILENTKREAPFPVVSVAPRKPLRIIGHMRPKARGVCAKYLYYCYRLGKLKRHPTSVKRVSFLLREDLTKLNKYLAQAKFLSEKGIDTTEELAVVQTTVKEKLEGLEERRHALRTALRRVRKCGDTSQEAILKTEIRDLTAEMKPLRKEIKLCQEIAHRSAEVGERIAELQQESRGRQKEQLQVRQGKIR